MKGKGWKPVLFDPLICYRSDGSQHTGNAPVTTMWPWEPINQAQDAGHSGKGFGPTGPDNFASTPEPGVVCHPSAEQLQSIKQQLADRAAAIDAVILERANAADAAMRDRVDRDCALAKAEREAVGNLPGTCQGGPGRGRCQPGRARQSPDCGQGCPERGRSESDRARGPRGCWS